MSDANRVQLAFIDEGAAFGIKKTGSNLQILRYNSESLKQDMNTVTSGEIRHDRQISDVARIGISASGDISFELSYGSHDELFKAALQSADWSSERRIERNTISVNNLDNSFNDSGGGFLSPQTLVANQWIFTSGFSNAANNGFFKIISVTASKLIVSGGNLVWEAVDDDPREIIMGAYITTGITPYSFNIEKDFKDASSAMLSLLKGMCINGFTLEIPADGIITGSFSFMGSAEESLIASAGSGHNDETTSIIMTGANHVNKLLENSDETAILSLSLNLNNNLRNRLQVGTLGVASIGSGTVEITGSLTLHLENAALYDKFLNQTTTSIALVVQDTEGNGYVIELPRVKIINGTRVAGGINTCLLYTSPSPRD